MYKIALPLDSELTIKDQKSALREAHNFDCERIMLSIDEYKQNPKTRDEILKNLGENCQFFKAHGYEVGAWLWTFLFRPEFSTDEKNFHPYVKIKDSDGTEFPQSACPMDERFIQFAADYVKRIAQTGVDMIMFDDDFGFGYCRSKKPSCLCDLHVARIKEIVNEDVDTDFLLDQILNQPKNKYRDAFLQANGESLENFARKMREAVDKVNPDIRLGFCTCMNSWDVDGTDANRLAKILAGNTKPFCRLTGAPYWANHYWGAKWTESLQDVIEYIRMECAWTKDDEIELFSEGDTFPRPRYNCPFALLEGYDTALRAAGDTDGILKYGIDYVSNFDYENGYRAAHRKNQAAYEWIRKHFDDKQTCGVRIYESMKKIADCTPCSVVNESTDFLNTFFSKAACAISYNAIPTVYEGKGVTGVVFDENARNLPKEAFENGLIIDITAAEILISRGIDVGIKSIGSPMVCWGDLEYFYQTKNTIRTFSTSICPTELNENAKILSVLKKGGEEYPMSYLYENANGQRFLVFTINSRTSSDWFRPYERNRQIAESVEWLGGKKLPAHVSGHPSLYLLCKESEGKLVIGIWNFFEDVAINPIVQLSEEYTAVEVFGCEVKLHGDKVFLSDIPAFGFVGIELSK